MWNMEAGCDGAPSGWVGRWPWMGRRSKWTGAGGAACVRRRRACRREALAGGGTLVIEPLEPRLLLSTTTFPSPLESMGHAQTLVYRGTTTDELTAEDPSDRFTVALDADQLISVRLTMADGDLAARLRVVDVTGAEVELGAADAAGPGESVVLGPLSVGGGDFAVDVQALAGDGSYTIELLLNAAYELSGVGDQDLTGTAIALGGGADRLAAVGELDGFADGYSFDLTAGDAAGLVVVRTDGSNQPVTMTLFDPDDLVTAVGVETSGQAGVENLTAPKTGTYRVVIDGASGPYTLAVTRGAGVESATNDDRLTAGSLGSAGTVLGSLETTYSQRIAASMPTAYWRLGESQGTMAADVTGHGFDGFYAGGVALGMPGPISTESDTAAGFDGIDDYVSTPDAPGLRFTTLTVEAWVNPQTSPSSHMSILTKSSSSSLNNGYGLTQNEDNRVYFWINGRFNGPDAELPVDQWSHVVGTYDGQVMRLFINGVEVASNNTGVVINHTDQPLRIGSGPGSSRWNGLIDEVALYDRALTAEEVASHYNSFDERDVYRVAAADGDTLTITTTTPFDGSGEPANLLNPQIELTDPLGQTVLIATNGAADGRNIVAQYVVPTGAGGLYHLTVSSESGGGAYVLSVQGDTGVENDSFATAVNLDGLATPIAMGADHISTTGSKLSGDQVFAVTLEQDVAATALLRVTDGPRPTLLLFGPDEMLAGIGERGAGAASHLSDFVPRASGVHYLVVRGGAGAQYELEVFRGITPDIEPNATAALAQPIDATGFVTGAVGGLQINIGPDGPIVELDIDLIDGEGFEWDIEEDGSVNDGTDDAYDGAFYLSLPGFNYFFIEDDNVPTEEDGRELVLGPTLLFVGEDDPGDSDATSAGGATGGVSEDGQIAVTRKIFVSPTEGFARYLESFTNVTDQTMTFTVRLETNLGSDSSTTIVGTSNGDLIVDTDDLWVISDDDDPGREDFSDPTLLHIVAGVGGEGLVDFTMETGDDDLDYFYELTLEPGQTKAIMHIAAQSETQQRAFEKAQQLSNLELGVTDGLTADEIGQIINFQLADAIDQFTFAAAEGDELMITTQTPGDSSNTLDPVVVLFAPDGSIAAMDDNSAADGRNVELAFTVPAGGAGRYRVQITDAIGPGEGGYLLNVTGATGEVEPFGVNRATLAVPPIGASAVAGIDIRFDRPIFALSLDPADLLVTNGMTLDVALIDARTARFTVDLTGVDAAIEMMMPASSVAGLTGQSFSGFTGSIIGDGPRVTDHLPTGVTTQAFDRFEFQFDRLLNTDSVSLEDVVAFTGPNGEDLLSELSFISRDSSAIYVFFNAQTTPGTYSMTIGPGILSSAGAPMNQDGDAINGEEEDTYTATVELRPIDLAAISFDAPASIEAGAMFSYSYRVENVGDIDAVNGWTDGLFLSDDAVFDRNVDQIIFNVSASGHVPLAPGQGYDETRSATLPGSTSAGPKFLLFVANPFDHEFEAEKSDNVIAIPITVTAPDVDLTVTQITAPTEATTGQSISVSWTVMNGGPATANADWTDQVFLSLDDVFDSGVDRFIGGVFAGNSTPLAGGASYMLSGNMTIPSNFAVGDMFLLVVADVGRAQPETNDANNFLAVPIRIILSPADLIVTNFTAPTEVIAGQSITASWTVQNRGIVSANNDWTDSIIFSTDAVFSSDDLFLRNDFAGGFTPLAGGVEYSFTDRQFTIPSRTAPGPAFLLLQTDRFFQQPEAFENNNVLAIPITVRAADLEVTSVIAPAQAVSGQQVLIGMDVRNNGDVPAIQGWFDQVWLSSDMVRDSSDTFVTSFGPPTPLDPAQTYHNEQLAQIRGPIVGDAFLIFVTDENNNLGETDEANNILVVPIHIDAPDLTIDITNAPTSVVMGQSMQIDYRIDNIGGFAAAAGVGVNFYISDDPFFDFTDTNITGNFHSETINAGSFLNGSVTATPFPPVSAGDRFLIVRLDDGNNQTETNENNNSTVIPIRIDAPDLRVIDGSAPFDVIPNQSITVNFTVRNDGEFPAPVEWNDGVVLSLDNVFSSNDRFLGSITNRQSGAPAVLEPGQSYNVQLNVTIPGNVSGNQFLILVADQFNQQGETNELNNGFALPVNIFSPDMVVTTVTGPATAASNETFNLQYTVRNQGSTEAPGNWVDRYYISTDQFLGGDTAIGSLFIDSQTPLATGATYDIDVPVTLPGLAPGNYFLIVRTDDNGNQGETNENNNIFATPITIQSPNLTITDSMSVSTAVVGQTITITYTVTNDSDFPALGDWNDQFFLSTDEFVGGDQFLASADVSSQSPLASGTSYTRMQQVTLPSNATGPRFLLIRTDGSNQQGESDENDNFVALPIDILQPPNLTVTEASGPAEAAVQQAITVNYTVTNIGENPAVSDWFDRVYLYDSQVFDNGGRLLASRRIDAQSPLDPDQSYSIDLSVTLPSDITGAKFLAIVANDSREQGETDFTDNVRFIPITIGAPDLRPLDADGPSTAQLGQSVSVSFSVINDGASPASANWQDRIYLSNDAILSGTDQQIFNATTNGTSPLAPGGTYMRNVLFNLPATAVGDRFLIISIDDGRQQGETSENNNTIAIPIHITAADLVVANVEHPGTVLSGQTFIATWTLRNDGDAPATGTWVDQVSLFDPQSGNNHVLGSFSFTGTIQPGQTLTRSQPVQTPDAFSGQRLLRVTTDVNNSLVESREDNNLGSTAQLVTIEQSPFPNLIVTIVTPSRDEIELGESLEVQFIIQNIGTGATSASFWTDSIHLSADETLDGTDIQLATPVNGTFLNPGESYSTTAVVTPGGVSDGDYFILVRADRLNQVNELTGEGDNVTASVEPIRIHLPPPPNMMVESVQAPQTAFSGQPMALTYRVRETGPGVNFLPEWFDDVIISSDDVLGNGDDVLIGRFRVQRDPDIFPETDYTNAVNVTLPVGISGPFFFFVRTDSTNRINEFAFEQDNTGFDPEPTTVLLTPPPDLEIDFIDVPASVEAGRNFLVHYGVTNFGATRTPNTQWTDSIYLSTDDVLDVDTDLLLANRLINFPSNFFTMDPGGIEPLESYEAQVSVKTPVDLNGPFFVFVVADRPNQVFELDNDNNVSSAQAVTVNLVPPDLVVSAISSTTDTVKAGSSLTVQWTTTNQGEGDTIVSSWTDDVLMSLDDVLGNGDDRRLTTVGQSGLLGPGASRDRAATVTIPLEIGGTVRLYVRSDLHNQVFEGGAEGNNLSQPLTILVQRETADLEASNNTPLPSLEMEDGRIRVRWHVDNVGIAATNVGLWYDAIIISGNAIVGDGDDVTLGHVLHGGTLVPAAAYDASSLFEVPFHITGMRHVFVRTDVFNAVDEDGSESNNAVSLGTFDIDALRTRPDLAVVDVVAPLEAISGQLFELTWTVQNLGDRIEPAEPGHRLPPEYDRGFWRDNVYLSRDQIFDPANDVFVGQFTSFVQLLADVDIDGQLVQQYTRTQTMTIPSGQTGPFYIFVVTDRNGDVVESNEQNNAAADLDAVFVTLAPVGDLSVTQVTVPDFVAAGEVIELAYDLMNLGAADLRGAWFDRFYISTDAVFSPDDIPFATRRYSTFNFFGSTPDPIVAPTQTVTIESAHRLPALVPGDYFLIVRADNFNQLPESDETNNTTGSAQTFHTDLPELTLVNGVATQPFELHLSTASTRTFFFKFDVEPGKTLSIDATWLPTTETAFISNMIEEVPASRSTVTSLYVARDRIPTPFNFDFANDELLRSTTFGGTASPLVIPRTEPGTYFIRLDVRDLHQFFQLSFLNGRFIDDSDEAFDLTIREVPFSIVNIDTNDSSLGNTGPATFRVTASNFNACSLIELLDSQGAVVRTATGIRQIDAVTADITFDFAGLTPGQYALRLHDHGGESDTRPLTIVEGIGAVIGGSIRGPRAVRTATEYQLFVNYGNAGDADGVPPLLILENLDHNSFALNRSELFSGQSETQPRSIQYLGISLDGDPGKLAPGELGSVPVYFRTTSVQQGGLGGRFRLHVIRADDATPIDYAAFEQQVRPVGIDDATWNEAFPRLRAMIGETFGGYVRALAATASRLGDIGIREGDVRFLFDRMFFEAMNPVQRTLGGSVVSAVDCGPVAEPTVTAYDAQGDVIDTAASDALGRYDFRSLPTGVYRLVVNAAGFARTILDAVSVPEHPSNLVIEMPVEAAIAGVLDLGGAAPAGALYLTAQRTDAPTDSLARFTVADFDAAHGETFRLGGLTTGEYDVTFQREGFVPHTTRVTVEEGQTLDLGDMRLTAAASISGQVVVAIDGVSAGDLVVGLFADGRQVTADQAAADGSFLLTDVAPGQYVAQIINAPRGVSTRVDVTVVEGQQVVDVLVSLVGGATISGQVTDGSGTPLSVVEVIVRTPRDLLSTYTGADGRYALTGLDFGEHLVSLAIGNIDDATVVNVDDVDEAVFAADLTFAPAARLTGIVMDSSGQPLVGAAVRLFVDDAFVVTNRTDSAGRYTFLLAQPGEYDLSAAIDGASFALIENVAVGLGQIVNRDITSGDGSVRITPQGGGTADAAVMLHHTVHGQRTLAGSAFVGPSGEVLFDDLAPGTYDVTVIATDGRASFSVVTVAQGEVTLVSPTVAATFGVSGDVTDDQGNPLAGATVLLSNNDNRDLAPMTVTDPTGRYEFSGVIGGVYDVIVIAEGQRTQVTEDVAVASSSELDFVLADSESELTGRVVDETGRPVPRGTVVVLDALQRLIDFGFIDEQGRFSLRGASGAGLKLLALSNGYLPAAVEGVTASGPINLGDLALAALAISQGFGQSAIPATPPFGAGAGGGGGAVNPVGGGSSVPAWLLPFVGMLEHHPDEVQLNEIPELPPNCDAAHEAEIEAVLGRVAQSLAYSAANNKLQEVNAQRLVTKALFVGEVLVVAGALAALVIAGEALIGLSSYAAVEAAIAASPSVAGPAVGTAATALIETSALNVVYQITQLGSSILALFNAYGEIGTATNANVADAATNAALTTAGEARGIVDNLQTIFENLIPGIMSAGLAAANQIVQVIGYIKTLIDTVQMPQFNAALDYLVELENDLTGLEAEYELKVIQANQKLNAYLAALALNDCDDDGDGGDDDPNDDDGGNDDDGDGNDNPNDPNNPTPPTDPDDADDELDPVVVFPTDPNDIIGPQGFGDENFIRAGEPLPYRIRFENIPAALAPAQRVTITQQLDDDLDPRTFRVGDLGWSSVVVEVPNQLPFFQGRIDVGDDSGLVVDIAVTVDVQTGIATWVFQTIDPQTGDPPTDALAGFLPANVADGIGEGFATYTIRPRRSAATGARIDAIATIVFDTQEPLDTPSIFNTLDAAAPGSSVLSAVQAGAGAGGGIPGGEGASLLPIDVIWSGQDDDAGSAIAHFTIFVSDDGGPFTPWLVDTTLTAATFLGLPGHTYGFYSVAADNAGNAESPPTAPDVVLTTSTDDLIAPTSAVLALAAVTPSLQFTVQWAGEDNLGGSGIDFFDVFVSVDDGPFTALLTGTTATSSQFTGEAGRTYRFFSVAVDVAGNREPEPAVADATTTIVLSTVPGDVTGDGLIDAADIDAIAAAVRAGDQSVVFDLDGDGAVTDADRLRLIRFFLRTEQGDGNLDGRVFIEDLAQLAAFFGSPGGWADGDADGDGVVDIADLRLMATHFRFTGHLPGDFNFDRVVDAHDIDILAAERRAGRFAPLLDLDEDGQLGQGDIDRLVLDILGTQYGDTNLNRRVDVADLARLASFFGGPGGWADGDTNGDGIIDHEDLSNLATNFQSTFMPHGGAGGASGRVDADTVNLLDNAASQANQVLPAPAMPQPAAPAPRAANGWMHIHNILDPASEQDRVSLV